MAKKKTRTKTAEPVKRGRGRPPLDPDQEGELPPRSVRLGQAEHEKVERVQAEMQARRITGTVSYSEAVRHLIRTSPL